MVDLVQLIISGTATGAIYALCALGFTLLLYLTELADVLIPANLDDFGIRSRQLSGLDGVLWAPLLHAGWSHLFSNTVPILIFGFLAMASGIGRWIAVTATVWILGGLGVWLVGPSDAVTVGPARGRSSLQRATRRSSAKPAPTTSC